MPCPTFLDPRCNPFQSDLWGIDHEIDDLVRISTKLPSGRPRGMAAPAKSSFKCKARSSSGQPINLGKKYSSCGDGSDFRFQRGKSSSDQICIDEMDDVGVPRKKFACERRLACTVRAGDDHTARQDGFAHFQEATFQSKSVGAFVASYPV